MLIFLMLLSYVKQHAIEGIRPTFEGLIKAGMLIKTSSPHSNFPQQEAILQGLSFGAWSESSQINCRSWNSCCPRSTHSSLKHAGRHKVVHGNWLFQCASRLHPDSQHFFAFTCHGEQYTLMRLPQGFPDSPSIFNKVLAQTCSTWVFQAQWFSTQISFYCVVLPKNNVRGTPLQFWQLWQQVDIM